MKKIIGCTLLFFAAALYASAAPTIQAISPHASGMPGSTVGWGFTLTYTDPSTWVILNDSFFTGSQVYGTYQDYVANETIVAGPSPESSVVTTPFSKSAGTGLGEFDINATAAEGVLITGNITVDYAIFSQDPNSSTFDPSSFVSAGQASTPVSINITPEPQSLGYIAVAILIAFALKRRLLRATVRS